MGIKRMPRRGAHGFTLIEILVVLAMIMILAALLFPVFSTALSSARRTACSHHLQMIAQSVELYRQDGMGYPEMPNYVGENGISQGGVSGLALVDKNLNTELLWCTNDEYPKQLPEQLWRNPADARDNGLLRDTTYSSYSFGYNYYGYVTTTSGAPFPVTTFDAARYFFGNPHEIDADVADPQWNLGLLKTFKTKDSAGNPTTVSRPTGLFQGLWNPWAPQNTVVTFCSHHAQAGENAAIPVVLLSGEAMLIHPVKPASSDGQVLYGGTFSRTNEGVDPADPDKPRFTTTTDWRINKAPFGVTTVVSNKNFGDAPGNASAQNMPIVQTSYRKFRVSDMTPYASGSYRWYDTGIALHPHDVVMVVAHAKWNYRSDIKADAWAEQYKNEEYAACGDQAGNLFFTADGDRMFPEDPEEMLLPKTNDAKNPHCLLVGSVGDIPGDMTIAANRLKSVFPLGSRGFYPVPKDSPGGSLRLTMNDTAGNFGDNVGWCEVWIAVYQP